ncbi:MAG: hypothetical protein RMJ87_08875 [Cytophagales bacterium]|nr:hypothetical protein [Bernardetiaceae bacterium]MDW8205126.1 hypothetical protein [Cytophagales bacterium]
MSKEHFNLIYEGALVHCSIEPTNKILYCEWLAANEMPSEELFKQEVIACFELIREKACSKVLDNSIAVNYPIHPEIQQWVADYMQQLAKEGYLKKYALIMPVDMIAELSNEQIIDEVNQAQQHNEAVVDIRNFYDEQQALNWLIS